VLCDGHCRRPSASMTAAESAAAVMRRRRDDDATTAGQREESPTERRDHDRLDDVVRRRTTDVRPTYDDSRPSRHDYWRPSSRRDLQRARRTRDTEPHDVPRTLACRSVTRILTVRVLLLTLCYSLSAVHKYDCDCDNRATPCSIVRFRVHN